MRLAADSDSSEKIRNKIRDHFAEFNRHSVPSTTRRYPTELRNLIYQGRLAGFTFKELASLSGMSSTAISYAIKESSQSKTLPVPKKKSKILTSRRLEVVTEVADPIEVRSPLLIRLPSGVVLELIDGSALTPSLIQSLANVVVNHVPTR